MLHLFYFRELVVARDSRLVHSSAINRNLFISYFKRMRVLKLIEYIAYAYARSNRCERAFISSQKQYATYVNYISESSLAFTLVIIIILFV